MDTDTHKQATRIAYCCPGPARAGPGENSECRAGHYNGYVTHKGLRIYEDDVLRRQVLVVSNQTAFDIDYLVELHYRVMSKY